MPEDPETIEYDCALAAALLIIDMLQTSPGATTPELVSFITAACLEAVKEAQRRASWRLSTQPSNN